MTQEQVLMIANAPDPSVNASYQMWVFLKQMQSCRGRGQT